MGNKSLGRLYLIPQTTFTPTSMTMIEKCSWDTIPTWEQGNKGVYT